MEDTISTQDLKAMLDRKESIKVVETLAPERYREARLPRSPEHSPDKIKELASQVLPNKNVESLPTARTRIDTAANTARELAAMGYTNVAHYPEGKQGWMEARLPVEKGAPLEGLCRLGHMPDVLLHRSMPSVPFLHLMAPYFFSISVVLPMGNASTVCPRPVVVVARNMEL